MIYKTWKSKVQLKVITGFVLALLLVLLGNTIVMNRFFISFIKEQRVKYNSQMMKRTDYELKSLYDRVNQFMINYGTGEYYQQLAENDGRLSYYENLKQELEARDKILQRVYANNLYEAVDGILFYWGKGDYIYAGDSVIREGFVASDEAWYAKFLEDLGERVVYGPVMEDYLPKNVQKQEVLLFLRPLGGQKQGAKGAAMPFMMIAIKFAEIEDIFSYLFSENKGLVITDLDGEVIYEKGVTEEHVARAAGLDYSELIRKRSEYLTDSKDGAFYTSTLLDSYGWVLTTVDMEKELFKDVNQLVSTVDIIIAIIALAGILIAMAVSRRALFPIQVLNKMIHTMEEDDDTYLDVVGDDEAGQIGERFNQMKKKIQELNAKKYLSELNEKEARLSMLQAQINPHFLHNTLDNIYCIAQIEEIEPIVKLTRDLSEMMRYSVNCKETFSTLKKELDHVRAYVDIINVRYDDSIDYKVEMEEHLEDVRCMKLLLQPLVENAWVHGILPAASHRGVIKISARVEGKDLLIYVEDNGEGMEEEEVIKLKKELEKPVLQARIPQNRGFGIALMNVNDRIKLVDGIKYGLFIESVKGKGSRVTVKQKYEISTE
ncbi:UNVERIFIED_CONTAM: histidine kinase/DNA gyrase B/HSP90-like ATPase [Murimonas intestini]|uniref:Histidine kinase/DNA gyrase B/HSP90-like ATPase n=2 Tax=Murimonas intestini TaxID=1337051 RepID=A0AB73T573_9FIRM